MKLRTFLGLILVLASACAGADMYVDRSIVIFEPDSQPRQDVKVSNTGDEIMYVEVQVMEVRNPGTPDEERVRVENPEELKLLATPNKLVLPAGGQKLIRIVNLQTSNQEERVYRINVTPIVPPLGEETSQLRIVVAYQILAIVRPDDPASELKVTRKGKQITFANEGNTNVLLSEGRQCRTEAETECEELASRRLYAGNTWQQELPFDAPVSYSVRNFDGIQKTIIP